MTRWEFTYVDLHAQAPDETIDPKDALAQVRDAIDRVKDTIAQLGDEGWEPVGEVAFLYAHGRRSASQLMLKRPQPD